MTMISRRYFACAGLNPQGYPTPSGVKDRERNISTQMPHNQTNYHEINIPRQLDNQQSRNSFNWGNIQYTEFIAGISLFSPPMYI